jgi:tetratricopeptide (TPR) repeat protein
VASVHLRLGHFPEARSVLNTVLARHPSDPALLSTLASVAMASGAPTEAVDILQDLIQSGNDHPINRYNLAYAFLYVQRFSEAKEMLAPILANPQTPDAPVLMARCLHHLGQLDEAIPLLKEFVAKNPQHGDAQGVLALMQLDSSNGEEALAAAEKALEVNPHDLGALVTMGSLALDTQDGKTASGYFDLALVRHPQSGRAWGGKALATMLTLDLPKAIEQLNMAVTHMPNHIGTWHALAWCQLLTDNLDGAKLSFEKSMEIDRNFGETHGGLAVVAVLQNRLDDAEQSIKRAIRLNPGSFAGRFAQTLLLNKTNPEQAKALMQSILSTRLAEGGETLQQILQREMRRRQPPTGNHGPRPTSGKGRH